MERTWLTTTLETRLKTTGILFSTTRIPQVAGQRAARAVHLAQDMAQDISRMVSVLIIWKEFSLPNWHGLKCPTNMTVRWVRQNLTSLNNHPLHENYVLNQLVL